MREHVLPESLYSSTITAPSPLAAGHSHQILWASTRVLISTDVGGLQLPRAAMGKHEQPADVPGCHTPTYHILPSCPASLCLTELLRPAMWPAVSHQSMQ